MRAARDESRIDGIETNLRWLREVVRNERFAGGDVSTRLLETVASHPRSIRVVSRGTPTTLQDWPGRQGLWALGVPPAGPMDDRSFRRGNRLPGNPAENARTSGRDRGCQAE